MIGKIDKIMEPKELQRKVKKFAIRIIKLIQ